MHDIVLIPTFRRPEYLTLCLEHIVEAMAQADGWKQVIVMHDQHTMESVETTRQVVRSFQEKLQVEFDVRKPHQYYGNSYNCLELYKTAFDAGTARYIYLIEDDVLVTPDFFAWHEAVQERGDYFATVGWKCMRNKDFKQSDDPSGYIETNKDFASIGICWRPDKLRTFIRHATPEYYSNSDAYLRKAFPNSRYHGGWTEQDGIVTRMLEETNDRWIAWPSRSRCTHVGISGYHRNAGYKFAGQNAGRNINECVDELRHAVRTPGRLAQLSQDPFNDVDVLPTVGAWAPEDLHVTQRLGIV